MRRHLELALDQDHGVDLWSQVKVQPHHRRVAGNPSAGPRFLRQRRDPRSGHRRDDYFTDLTAAVPTQMKSLPALAAGSPPKATASSARHSANCSPGFTFYLHYRRRAQSGNLFAAKSAIERPWYKRKTCLVSFEDILRNLRQATWQEKIFSDPRLDAHTRKSFNPLQSGSKAAA